MIECDEKGCFEPVTSSGSRATCHTHRSSYKGNGKKITCGICGKPQRRHARTFTEHTEITTQVKTRAKAISDRK